jgi:PilZ domain-containing protein
MTTPFSDEVPDSTGRISPRHVFETRVRIGVQRDTQSLTLQGWTRDLSEGGLNAFVAQVLALGEFVKLEIPLSGSGQYVIPAKVVRALGTDGFQFTALSAEQRMQIRATLKGRPAIPYLGSG